MVKSPECLDVGMSALIDAATLAAQVERGEVVVLDVQYSLGGPPSRDLYAVAHLPGAPHLALDEALAGPPGEGGRHPLPDPGLLQEALRECGVDHDSRVVVYDQGTSLSASRAWWVLRWAGLTDVRVLDGGLAGWQRAGLPVVSGDLPAEASTSVEGTGGEERRGTMTVRAGALPVVDVADVPAAARAGMLVDVRAPERYRGEVEPIDPVAGHIPGAVNVPMSTMQQQDGTFRSPDQIRALAAASGIDGTQPVTTSCGSGVTATQMVLALGEAGIEATPYIGSWSGWITDPDRPVAIGPEPG